MMIGRKEELDTLKREHRADEARLVAVYGRRRIGKTYLVKEAFDNRFFFKYTGAYNITNKDQLTNFHDELVRQGFSGEDVPKNWFQAFGQLRDMIESSKARRKVVFIDEMPWMDAPRSRFLPAFESFWNGWASARKDIMLIICGSASSWIIKKVLRNKGGLHNRVSTSIHLHQFTLAETEEYVIRHKLGYTRDLILQGYMVMGGVPYYWSKLRPEKSMAQNINDLFLKEDGELRYEFERLYNSIFTSPEKYIAVIEALSSKKKGLTRDEIVKVSGLENNGHLSTMIQNLIQCGFIRKYCHTDKELRDAIYQLVDCYTLFYYQFVKNAHGLDDDYWLKIQRTPTYNSWSGLAFERVCLLHLRQIKDAIGISGIVANAFSWHVPKTEDHPGVQIDLLIDRNDNVIDVCEMKYAPNGYTMTPTEAKKMKERVRVLSMYMPQRKAIRTLLITSDGEKGLSRYLPYSRHITAEALFK